MLSLCLTDGSFATLHVPMKPQNWHGPVSCHTHATSATDGPRVPQFEPPCASLPHAIGGDRVVQAACSSLGVIDLLTYTPSSGTRRLAALQWPVPHRQKPGGRGSASKEDASHVLAMEFMPLAG